MSGSPSPGVDRASAGAGTTAVVLSGGGARAAYQIGVLHALLEGSCPSTGYRPLDADIFTGTSAGAFNAAHLVSHAHEGPAASRRLMDVWLKRIARPHPILGNGVFRLRAAPLAIFDGVSLPRALALARETGRDAVYWMRELAIRGQALGRHRGSLIDKLLDTFDLSCLFSTEPLLELVAETIDWRGLEQARQRLQLVAADWASGQIRLFSKSEIAGPRGPDVIRASAAIPGLFPPVEIDGRSYVDGSLVMATPLGPAIAAGADTLHVIYLEGEAKNGPMPGLPNTIDTVSRVFVQAAAGRIDQDIRIAAEINREVQLVDDLQALGLDLHQESEGVALLSPHSRVLRRIQEGNPYRQLTIHRYRLRPERSGSETLLDFDPDYLRQLIRTGFGDAAGHDCQAEGCLLPESSVVGRSSVVGTRSPRAAGPLAAEDPGTDGSLDSDTRLESDSVH